MFDGAAELNRPAAAAARHIVWLGRVKQGRGGAAHWPAAGGREMRGHGGAPFRKRQAFVGRSARPNNSRAWSRSRNSSRPYYEPGHGHRIGLADVPDTSV